MTRRILTADWVLPITAPPIEHGAVLIDEHGAIEAVAGAAELKSDAIPTEHFGRAAILPGLINVHSHPELAPLRGLLDDLPFHLWIPALMKSKRGAQLSEDDYAAAAQWTCIEAARAGVTTLGATEASGSALSALRAAGMRGVVYIETFGPAPEQVGESLSDLLRRMQILAPLCNDLVQIGVSPHAPYSVSDTLYVAASAYARSESLPLATHAGEAETEELLVREGIGPFAAGLRARGIATPQRGHSTIELLDRLNVLGERTLLIHCVRISREDIARIAASGSAIAHCPVANARLGHGTAPMVEARAAGITVAIGTDSVASNNRIDLLEEARIAQIAQRARLAASGAFPAEQLLPMITIDAARALGIDSRVGSLEVGKDADLCVISLERAHTRPVGSIENALIHAARGSDVRLTTVQGRVVFDGERVQSLNEAEIGQRIDELAVRLRHARDEA